MRDTAGSGEIPEIERIEDRWVLDAAAFFALNDSHRFYAKLENAFDNGYAVSRRPFGLRPGMPLNAMVGYKGHFGN